MTQCIIEGKDLLTPREKHRVRLHKLLCTDYLKYREKYERTSNYRICLTLAERYKLSAGGVRKILVQTLGEKYESYSFKRANKGGEA